MIEEKEIKKLKDDVDRYYKEITRLSVVSTTGLAKPIKDLISKEINRLKEEHKIVKQAYEKEYQYTELIKKLTLTCIEWFEHRDKDNFYTFGDVVFDWGQYFDKTYTAKPRKPDIKHKPVLCKYCGKQSAFDKAVHYGKLKFCREVCRDKYLS